MSEGVSKGSYRSRLRGRISGEGFRIALVVARFNESVTELLLEGAVACLRAHGVSEEDMEVFRVPGAWELPLAARRVAGTGRWSAVIALGCVIRGETPHFEYICAEAARGLGAAARDADIPIIFGLLTTETPKQALERARQDEGDKGGEAALAALEMAALFERLA